MDLDDNLSCPWYVYCMLFFRKSSKIGSFHYRVVVFLRIANLSQIQGEKEGSGCKLKFKNYPICVYTFQLHVYSVPTAD